MGWKGVETEGRTLLSSENIKWAQWLRVARNFQLRVGMKDRKKYTFDGFLREVSRLHGPIRRQWSELALKDHDKLASLLKQHFGITLEVKDVSVKGWNWGVTDFQGASMASSMPHFMSHTDPKKVKNWRSLFQTRHLSSCLSTK